MGFLTTRRWFLSSLVLFYVLFFVIYVVVFRLVDSNHRLAMSALFVNAALGCLAFTALYGLFIYVLKRRLVRKFVFHAIWPFTVFCFLVIAFLQTQYRPDALVTQSGTDVISFGARVDEAVDTFLQYALVSSFACGVGGIAMFWCFTLLFNRFGTAGRVTKEMPVSVK